MTNSCSINERVFFGGRWGYRNPISTDTYNVLSGFLGGLVNFHENPGLRGCTSVGDWKQELCVLLCRAATGSGWCQCIIMSVPRVFQIRPMHKSPPCFGAISSDTMAPDVITVGAIASDPSHFRRFNSTFQFRDEIRFIPEESKRSL